MTARLYGLMAEFENPQDLVEATRRTRESGFTRIDAYSPYPIEALTEALDIHDRKLPAVVLGGGIVGGLCGYALCYWTSVIAYPLNIGGKPFHSAPAFIVPTFETTILFAAFAAVLGMLALNGLPMPYHPVFNAPRFALASRDRFFLCIEARDPKFDHDETWAFLTKLGPRGVMDVEEGGCAAPSPSFSRRRRSPAAAATCRTSPSTRTCAGPRSSRTGARRARSSRTRSPGGCRTATPCS